MVRAIRDAADPAAAAAALRHAFAAADEGRGARWLTSRGAGGDAPERHKRKSRAPRDRMMEGYARAEERNQAAREALEPLAEGERPAVVTVGAVLTGLIAISILSATSPG